MSCVNTKSKEFIETAKRLDLSSGTLELIVHEFQNTEGNEEDFPSDTYIVEKLQGESMTNASEDQVKLWESKYSNPVTASTSKEAEQIATEASRCFPKQSIKIYGTNNGKYKVTVARPFTEAYVKEVQTILRNATRDSQGRLLAPNGEPSNLTEQQYAQVRTKAFINWFGDWINNPENASKVVDENGEPLIVYHGSKSIFNIFDPLKSENRQYLSEQINATNFFSSDKTVADFFALTEKQSIASQISRSISIVLDAYAGEEVSDDVLDDEIWAEAARRTHKSKEFVKNFWENEVPKEYKMEDEFGNTRMKDPNIDKYKYSVFINMRDPLILDAKGERADRFIESNKEILNNNDEVIIKNINETVGKEDTATDYLVRNPNQIKSATDNIGTFSTENNNIYLHTSNIARVRDLLNEFKDKIISFTKTKDIEAYIFKKNKELSSLIPGFNLSAYIQREKGKARFRDSKSSTALEELINLENPMSKDEMEQLFTLLSGKFNMTFEIAETTQGKIVTESGNTQTRCFITKEDGKFKVYINKDKLPSYTILAEEMLHPLVDVIQHDNLTLFNKFLAEIEGIIKSKKDPVLNGIISNIGNSYAGKSSDIINNEKVTQTLAYFLKNSTKEEKSSTFKKIIEAIVKILQKFGIVSDKLVTPNFNLRTFAYVLKFENVTLDISRAFSTTNTYFHKESSETVYSQQEAYQLKKDLIEGGYKPENIKIEYIKGTEELDDSWVVSYVKDTSSNEALSNEQSVDTSSYKFYSGGAKDSDKRRTYTGKITSLSENQVFVFGSNPEGRHGAGAARTAANNFGAVYGNGEGMQGQSYALPTKRIKSMQFSKSGQMTFSYGNSKRSDVQSSSAFEAIINGERTATTRYLSDGNIEYWQDLKVGDIVAFKSAGGKGTVYVRITKPLTKLDENTNAEVWSKKEGWSVEYYESKVKPKVLAGEAFQMEYEFVDAYGERTVTSKEIRENIKRMYEVARKNPDREFIVAYSKDGKNLNGYTAEEMAEMFASEEIPSNIVFEEGFNELVFNKKIKTNQEYTPIDQPSTDFSMFESKDTLSTETQDEETTALVNEIDAVNESAVMTSTEVTKVAQKISYWISDKITEFAKNPELIFIKFPDKRTLDESGQWTEDNKTKDIEKVKSMSRLSLIRFITPGNLLELCKMEFDKSTTLRTKKKVRFIKNNWNAIISLGSKTLAELEKVTFANDNAEEVLTMEDPDFNSEDTTEGVQETQGNLQEQWQIETKTKDVISTMSQLVRLELRQCFELEEDGFNEDGSTKYKRVQDEFGMDERVVERTIVQSLLSWFKGVENIKDMISTLEGKVDKNPWVSQLLTKLKDTSGDSSDFQSQFFSTFYTAFQTYSVVSIDEDSGKYYTQIVNENPALKEVINSIKVLQKLGTLPIFNATSINSERLQELKDEYNSLSEILKKIKNRKLESLSSEDLKDATESIGYAAYLFGYTISPDMVKDLISYDSFNTIVNSLEQIVRHLEDSKNSKIFEPLVYKNEHSIIGNLKSFLKPLVSHLEDITVESVHNDGKMYQSYVIPSYTSRLMDRFHLKGDRFKEFINNEYDTSWFKEPDTDFTRGWRNSWLRTLVNNPEARNIFKHKIALNFNKKNYMKNMTESEYLLSILTEYFSSDPKNGRALSWFRIPMQSNKPANEFIRFYSERGTNYKEIITDGFYDIFLQELSRIQTVLMRDLNPSDPTYIKNFDKNGKKFCFLSYFNNELTSDSELGKLIQASINGEQLSPEEIIRLEELAKSKIKQEMNAKANSILDRWEASGVMEAAKSVQGVNKDYVKENLENFIWNDTFAAMNILQLTITDIAYYKDAEDLQKRLAQLHAPGIRGNIFATDYNGELVSADQKERVIYLKDFDSFKSNIIENIRVVFDRKIEQAPESEKAGLIALRDSLVKEPIYDKEGNEIERGGSYWYINVTDAQAYNSITSYRKKAFIFGKWSRSAEEVYEKIKSNDYTYTELQAAFQPLKPFTYSQVQVGSGVDNAPLSTLKMGVQHKDSEYLLIMAGAILQGEDTGKPNLLRVINEIMEESADSNKGRGIDTVIFESGVKAGLTGVIDLNPYIDMPNGDKEAKAYLERILYNDTLYNPDYVQEIPFSDYSLQQEVPSHFAGHEQAHGSQIRYITPSDLVAIDSFGNTVFYEVRGRKLTAEEFRKEYEETIAANIKESIELLTREFNLDSLDPKEKRKAISRLLVEEIRSNPRYGIDMLYACSIDPKTGDFRIPLGDPIQAKRVEQLLNSIVKNRINKQEISGGPVVQVSNFGTSKELNVKFKSRTGGVLLTRKEFEQNNSTGYKTYEEYIKNEQAGIAYLEVYAPAYSKEIFTDFMDSDGTVDIKAIEALNPELLKMVGYRIPTEDKYSTLPLKIVGFLPREAGEGIMMPNDITLITGSDFDIDKMYLMIKKLDIDPKSRKDISKSLWDKFSSKYKTFSEKNALRERINMFLDNPQIMKSADPEMWDAYKKVAYTVTEPKEGTRYDRDNKIIDMTYAVLTHETVADKILNPGNFEEQKKMGYIAVAKKITNYSYEELYAMDVETLKKICTVDKNLSFIDTHIQFYKQNSAAGSLIGTFAVHKVAHAILESDSFYIDALGATNSINPFTIAGFEFTGNMKIDPTKDSKGNLVGKTLGCLVASSVDAVKDPVLNLMNINSNTSSVLTTLIRLGMPFEEAALFMSQSCITDLISSFEISKLADPNTSLKKTILERLKEMQKNGEFSKELESEELTKEELINGLTGYSDELEYKVLNNLYKILSIADQLKTITYVTRLNSISNAVGPLVIDNLIMEHKLAQYSEFITKDGEPVTTIDVLEEHPILREFYKALGIAKELLSDMPTNSNRFRNLISFNSKIEDIMFSDRKLLNQLSDFYQSFCYVESGVINTTHLPNYIDAFPLYFISKNFKEQYKDNALIQAIKYTEEDGRLVLKIDISGLNSTEKELLSSAWADLHKVNPQLSIQLFNYNFFRSGVGFSPKTFNNLLPSYVKARIKGYTEAFKSTRLRDERFIMDLFIRHNWDNNKLVPWRSYKKIVDHIEGNILTIKEELAGLPGVDYFKMYFNKKVQMFRRTGENTFEIVEPLGNNGEYVEISLDKDYKAREVPKTALSKLRADEVVAKDEEESASDMLTDIEIQARAELILEIFSTNDSERPTTARIKEFRNRTEAEQSKAESKIKEFISKRLSALNIEQSAEYIEQLYNDLLTNENLCK